MIETPERLHDVILWVFIIHFEQYLTPFSSVSIVNVEQVNICWACMQFVD